jgi:hypothetical protein
VQTLAVETAAPADVRSEHFLATGALSIVLVTAVLVGWAIVVMAWVSPIAGDAMLIVAGLVGLIDALFVTPMRLRIDGREVEVRTVARSKTFDGYTLIARRVAGGGYSLASKARPHSTVAWVRQRDLAALSAAGVDIA